MPKKSKKANDMTDKELLHAIFPKEIRDALKKVAVKSTKKAKK